MRPFLTGAIPDGLERWLSAAAGALREHELSKRHETELEQHLERRTDRVAALREEAAPRPATWRGWRV
ncbi:MAG: hypothetical protein FWJ70_14620 [Micromonosporaceae bacterium]|jgi:hypothetical protein